MKTYKLLELLLLGWNDLLKRLPERLQKTYEQGFDGQHRRHTLVDASLR